MPPCCTNSDSIHGGSKCPAAAGWRSTWEVRLGRFWLSVPPPARSSNGWSPRFLRARPLSLSVLQPTRGANYCRIGEPRRSHRPPLACVSGFANAVEPRRRPNQQPISNHGRSRHRHVILGQRVRVQQLKLIAHLEHERRAVLVEAEY